MQQKQRRPRINRAKQALKAKNAQQPPFVRKKRRNRRQVGLRNQERQDEGIVQKLFRMGLKYGGPIANHIFGSGDYITKGDVVRNSLFKGGNYEFTKQRTFITHREYIADVISSPTPGAFSFIAYSVNPGSPITFPWLSQIAQNYESYKMHGLCYEYKSMSADALNSVNTALGQVILSVQYDAANAPFTNKQSQEQYDGAISVKPSQSVLLGVECEPVQSVLQMLYIRNQTLPANTAIQFCDMAQFQISTNGMQGSSVNLGELWVTYHVELIHEKVNQDPGSNDYSRYSQLVPLSGYTNIAASTFQEGVTLILTTSSINTGNLPPGNYILTLLINGITIVGTGDAFSGTGVTFNNIFKNNTVSVQQDSNPSGMSTIVAFTTLQQNAIIVLSGVTWTGTVTASDLLITAAGNPE